MAEKGYSMTTWQVYIMVKEKTKDCPSAPTIIKLIKLLFACRFLGRRKIRGRFYYYPMEKSPPAKPTLPTEEGNPK